MQYSFGRFVLTGMASLLLPAISVACTCADPGQISKDKVIDAMCTVDAVFVGKATALVSTSGQPRLVKIDTIRVFSGDVSKFVYAETSTTCDHWYTPNNNYLIFLNIESGSNEFSTSICGPTRFTGDMASAQFQLGVVEENIARLGELCGAAESGARQIRIIRQDRYDRERYQAESLRLLKESVRQGRADYEQALEEIKTIREEEK